jgi:calmodulin
MTFNPPPRAALPEDKLNEVKEAFQLFDTESNGGISISQIPTVLRSVGLTPTETEVRRMVLQVQNDTGIVKWSEFLPLAEQAHASTSKMKLDAVEDMKGLEAGMKRFFGESGTAVSVKNLRHVLSVVGEKLSDEEWRELQKELPVEDGKVEFGDFVKMLTV